MIVTSPTMKQKQLAFIPARDWPLGKMTKLLAGKPLVWHTLAAAAESNCFSRIVLFTNSHEVALVGESISDEVLVISKPDYLASKQSTVWNNLWYFLNSEQAESMEFDRIAMLLPTSPLRGPRQIQEGLTLLDKSVNSVIGVSKEEYSAETRLVINEEGWLEDVESPEIFDSQNISAAPSNEYYYPNGSLYAAWRTSLRRHASFFKGRVLPYVMDKVSSWRVTSDEDFKLAELLLSTR